LLKELYLLEKQNMSQVYYNKHRPQKLNSEKISDETQKQVKNVPYANKPICYKGPAEQPITTNCMFGLASYLDKITFKTTATQKLNILASKFSRQPCIGKWYRIAKRLSKHRLYYS